MIPMYVSLSLFVDLRTDSQFQICLYIPEDIYIFETISQDYINPLHPNPVESTITVKLCKGRRHDNRIFLVKNYHGTPSRWKKYLVCLSSYKISGWFISSCRSLSETLFSVDKSGKPLLVRVLGLIFTPFAGNLPFCSSSERAEPQPPSRFKYIICQATILRVWRGGSTGHFLQTPWRPFVDFMTWFVVAYMRHEVVYNLFTCWASDHLYSYVLLSVAYRIVQ